MIQTRIFFLILPVLMLSACLSSPSPMGVPDSPFGYGRAGTIETPPQPVPVGAQTYPPMTTGAQEQVIDPFNQTPPQQQAQTPQEVKVALLLPLTGQHQAVGQALLQSAQLALFDMEAGHITLLPKDTKGTATGASIAAQQAVDEGASLMIGPLFSQAVSGAGSVAQRNNIPLIGFSTDRNVAGFGRYIMGVLPEEQAARMADFAATKGWRRVLIVTSGDVYGDMTAAAFRNRALSRGVSDIQTATVQDVQAMTALPHQAVFMPLSGPALSAAVQVVRSKAPQAVLLGTGLWDDKSVQSNRMMNGAVYAAPPPRLRQNFESKYRQLYGDTPPRIASIAYDATALAVVLSGRQIQNATTSSTMFSGQAITNPSGYSGIDGIFRFRPDGTAQRGLAVLTIRGGRAVVSEAAPSSFSGRF